MRTGPLAAVVWCCATSSLAAAAPAPAAALTPGVALPSLRPRAGLPSPLPRQGPPAPWEPRSHQRPPGMPSPGLAVVDQSRWPAEPRSPTPIVAAELAVAPFASCAGGS